MSKGLSVKVVAGAEVRTVVAVKELSKTAHQAEERALREFLLLSKRLQPPHPNIIRILGVEVTSSMMYVCVSCVQETYILCVCACC